MSKINKIKIKDISYDVQDLSVGELNNLETENKTNIVAAINEVLNDSKDYIKEIPEEYITEEELNGKNYSTFSGSYDDLKNKPTIPTVPTNVSAFNNDAGYLTEHQDISGKADKTYVDDAISNIGGGVSLDDVKAITGEVENLSTTDKSTLVNAINEVFNALGSAGGITEVTSKNITMSDYKSGIFINRTRDVTITLPATTGETSAAISKNCLWFWNYTSNSRYSLLYWSESSSGDIGIYDYFTYNTTQGQRKYLSTSSLVGTSNEQTIKGKKTFTVLPESSVTPTTNTQLVNKKYVDDAIGTALGGSY